VTVHSLSVQAGSISGDIVSSGVVSIADNSSVDGNIKAERIEVNGKVVGNLESTARVVLNPRSVIEGNITAMELSMSEGAELKGNVNVHRTA
jgi:cytoskeletal protein CcmA (bactofilin family)